MLKLIRLLGGHNINIIKTPLALNTAILAIQTASCFVVYFMLSAFLETGTETSAAYSGMLCLLLVLLFGLYYGLVLAYAKKAMSGGYRVVADLRTTVCDHLRRLSLAFFRKHDPANLSNALLKNMTDTEAVFGIYIYEMAACVVVPVVLGLVMAFMDLRITGAMIAAILLAVPFVIYSSNYAIGGSRVYTEAMARTDAALQEYLSGIGELKGAGRTGAAFTPFTKSNDELLDLALRLETRFGVLGQIYLGIVDLAFVAVFAVGSLLLTDGSLHLAVFLFFLMTAYRLVDPLQNLGAFFTEFRFLAASMRRIAVILWEKALPVCRDDIEATGNGIEFSDVSFAYGEKEVLSGISFSVPEGSVTALVGESGGGKTTISNLLLRFWDVRSGSVRIGGRDIRSFSQEDLYARFSVVFQDVYLFNDTVMNNIRLARPGATDEDVLEASRLACCHEFIIKLDKGYDTMVGERGSRLSGGERQRIAIARAILKNAPILILDEATASVDPENELQIQQGLTNLTRGKTLLVSAHRLTTIRQADQILVLRGGTIAERGAHRDLIQAGGIYKRLWDSQEKLKSWKLPSSGGLEQQS